MVLYVQVLMRSLGRFIIMGQNGMWVMQIFRSPYRHDRRDLINWDTEITET